MTKALVKSKVQRRAVLATAAAALAGAGMVRLREGAGVEAGGSTGFLEIRTSGTSVVNNTATGRTNLRADRGSTHTLTLQNIGTSTAATRGTLYAYLGATATLPETQHTSAVRGLNETTDDFGAGVSGEGPRGIFGQSNHANPVLRRGVVGTTDGGVGVEGTSRGGVGVGAFAEDPGGIAVRAEAINGANALEIIGHSEFTGQVIVDGQTRIDASSVDANDAGLHVKNLNQGVGILVARSSDSGAIRPDAGFSDGFAGIVVDLLSSDIDLPAGAGLTVTTGPETGAILSSAGGTALEVHGPALFDGPSQFLGDLNARRFGGTGGVAPVFQNAGVATVPAGKAAVRVTNASVKPGASVIATLQGNAGVGVVLKHITVLKGRFNVVLSKKAARDTKIAYFVLGAP